MPRALPQRSKVHQLSSQRSPREGQRPNKFGTLEKAGSQCLEHCIPKRIVPNLDLEQIKGKYTRQSIRGKLARSQSKCIVLSILLETAVGSNMLGKILTFGYVNAACHMFDFIPCTTPQAGRAGGSA